MPGASRLALHVSHLTCRHDHHVIFSDISFSIVSGQALQILGCNGSGKTTLLRWLAGLRVAERGDLNLTSTREEPCLIRFIGHEDGLDERLTVQDQTRLWQVFDQETRRDTPGDVCLGDVCTLTCDNSADPFSIQSIIGFQIEDLSRGWRRRLALSRLTSALGGIWLLDEPLSHLDEKARITLLSLLRDHLKAGGIVIMSSHEAMADLPTLTLHLSPKASSFGSDLSQTAPTCSN